MKLYLESQIKAKSLEKWGSEEALNKEKDARVS